MDGLVVVGLRPGAAEGAVAAAIGAVLHHGGQPARVVRLLALGDRAANSRHAYGADASPVTAARHPGETLAPAALAAEVRAAERAPIVAIPGGILAALTTRYTTR